MTYYLVYHLIVVVAYFNFFVIFLLKQIKYKEYVCHCVCNQEKYKYLLINVTKETTVIHIKVKQTWKLYDNQFVAIKLL